MEALLCRLRHRKVAATPEELIRQGLLGLMLEQLNYPRSLLAIEVALAALCPHLPSLPPSRRVDIVCYTPKAEGLAPLLLIECKAIPLDNKALRQATGYNYYLSAPFIALANATTIYTGYYNISKRDYAFAIGLPSYSSLLQLKP